MINPLPKSVKSDSTFLESSAPSVAEYLHFDDVDNTFTHEVVQDVDPVLRSVKELSDFGGKSETGELYHAARIPEIVVMDWMRIRGLNYPADFKGRVISEFLNDSDNSAWRIWQGRV